MTVTTHADHVRFKQQVDKQQVSAARFCRYLVDDPEWTNVERVRIKEALKQLEKINTIMNNEVYKNPLGLKTKMLLIDLYSGAYGYEKAKIIADIGLTAINDLLQREKPFEEIEND